MNEEREKSGKDLPEGRKGPENETPRGLPIWADIATAFLFLSRIPMPYYGRQISVAAWAFPIVGWLVGAIGAGVFILATFLGLTGWLAAVLAIVATVFVTGALHEDGFSDVADGYWGGHSVEKRLSIMRDSSVGAYGALALVLNIALRAGALASFYNPILILVVMVSAHGLGRASMSMVMALQAPAGKTGMAATAGKTAMPIALIALVLGLLPFSAFIPVQAAVFIAAVPLVAGVGFMQIMKAKLGGTNGDSLGALCQVVEITTYLTVMAVGNTLGFSLSDWLIK
ncbi:adenosylcobinamide-GDP ribazoletransferase [Curvivirga aplysinae]|uniref:adenosylcobinamide-GDP ribazoletransferase n=1 Tax=Curvivirga aplysinae TaxID=2529852 RepID=UPI0012BCD8FE|nr:adenosylcobinamide-GDP ribazoletransferase [Curvivirga aplysinae]MTI11166.1 adenosylcobinamide-GDP ribazoletransferase [Curvivirga aplysinae]